MNPFIANQAPTPERHLKRGERTDPAGVLDQDAPQGRRYVQPAESWPAEGREAADQHENHEA